MENNKINDIVELSVKIKQSKEKIIRLITLR